MTKGKKGTRSTNGHQVGFINDAYTRNEQLVETIDSTPNNLHFWLFRFRGIT